MPAPKRIVIATRQSRLALWQAEHVKQLLERAHPGCDVALLPLSTRGDEVLDRSLAKIGGKGLFVKELELAIETGRADLAVHSAKDVPMNLPPGFMIAAILAREDPRDAFISNRFGALADLPADAVVGTSSLRREAQFRERSPLLRFKPLRGNLDTRLAKLDNGECDAAVLALAGLRRLGLEQRVRSVMSVEDSLPAPGQGALAIEARSDAGELLASVAPLADPATTACVTAERAVSRALGGSCQVPLAAYATLDAGRLRLRGLIAMPDASRVIRAEVSGAPAAAEALGEQLANELRARGAGPILAALADR